jgi:glutamate synthase domain-containing protein 3
MVDLEGLTQREDADLVQGLIERHVKLTRSVLGRRLLDDWEKTKGAIVKVMPKDYARVLAKKPRLLATGTQS